MNCRSWETCITPRLQAPRATPSEEQDGAIQQVRTGWTTTYYGMQLTSRLRVGLGRTLHLCIEAPYLNGIPLNGMCGCFLLAASKYKGTENHREAFCPISSHSRRITFVVSVAMKLWGNCILTPGDVARVCVCVLLSKKLAHFLGRMWTMGWFRPGD